jgi:hypothetical protein
MTSPRFYNFETDRVFANISEHAARKLFAYSRKLDNHATLAKVIRARFTSRDGFHSFYSNSLAEWLEKPLDEWDHNELGTLLIVACESMGDDWEQDIEGSIIEREYEYLNEAIDWEKYQTIIDDMRAEKLETWREENPEIEPPYRCAHTLDMFPSETRTQGDR